MLIDNQNKAEASWLVVFFVFFYEVFLFVLIYAMGQRGLGTSQGGGGRGKSGWDLSS